MTTPSDLLQSPAWERFQRALGCRTERVDGVLVIEMPLPLGLTYFYSPRASVATSQQLQDSSSFCESLQRVAVMERVVFFRAPFPTDQLAACGLRLRAPAVMRHSLEPEWTWRTSLDGTDDEFLARMHEKHRYNIRVAARRGVSVRCQPAPIGASGASATFGDDAWCLLHDTARRQGIQTHPRTYYETMVRELSRKPPVPTLRSGSRYGIVGTASRKPEVDCFLYTAEHAGAAVACAIVAHHDDTATYLHGGSSYAHRALMAPHLLHWRAMCDAAAAGMRWYDWGGIEPPKTEERRTQNGELVSSSPSPSPLVLRSDWSGMTRFKTGFGGEVVHHPPTCDLVFRPGWYRMLSWLARMRG